MTREEFSLFVEATLERAVQFAEQMSGRTLPRNHAFVWMCKDMEPIRQGIVEEIVSKVFVDDEHIFPCVDIGVVSLLDDETVLVTANVAGYPATQFGKNWTGTDGPFIYIVNKKALEPGS
jgi:hypothetical protein